MLLHNAPVTSTMKAVPWCSKHLHRGTAQHGSLLVACHLSCQALIVDEAHRLKNQKSATRLALQEMSVKWLLMLSGTPVQNNMKELQVSGTAGCVHAASM